MEYKGMQIVGDGTYGYKEIKAIGKGSVHLTLRGSYTNASNAMVAIDTYLRSKEKKNGKSTKGTGI